MVFFFFSFAFIVWTALLSGWRVAGANYPARFRRAVPCCLLAFKRVAASLTAEKTHTNMWSVLRSWSDTIRRGRQSHGMRDSPGRHKITRSSRVVLQAWGNSAKQRGRLECDMGTVKGKETASAFDVWTDTPQPPPKELAKPPLSFVTNSNANQPFPASFQTPRNTPVRKTPVTTAITRACRQWKTRLVGVGSC